MKPTNRVEPRRFGCYNVGAGCDVQVNQEQWVRFEALARELGFVAVAAAPNHQISCGDRLRDWVRRGMHGSMEWFARAVDKRLDLNLVLEDAASVIVLTTPYEHRPCTLGGKKLARYACGDDYHDVLKKKLWTLIEALRVDFPKGEFRPYVDTGPLLERYWAQQAGLGWIGKSGNLISRQWGSYIFLSCIVTNLAVPYGVPHGNYCGQCRACIDACPTDAIVADGMVDSRKCISYLSIEHRGPFEDAPDFADWIFGCDICQEVCPWTQKFSQDPVLAAFLPRSTYGALGEAEVLAMEQAQFSATFSKSAIKRTKMAGIKRNMAHLQDKETGDRPEPDNVLPP